MTERGTPSSPTFAIVVPAYNETSGHLAAMCAALLALTPRPDEIIFVDDGSTNDTPNVIRQYLVRPSIRLIVQPANRGPAAARNVGVTAATSAVVVFVDADNILPPDFLARLRAHYEQGADAVAVEAVVASTETVYERFFQAHHEYLYGADKPVGFTQAYSCRRALALQAGLFPEELPVPGGEDGEFERRVSRCTSRRVVDKTIVVRHITPGTMRGFWRQWRGRGIPASFMRHHLDHVRWPRLVAERAAAAIWSLSLILTLVPVLRRATRLAALSERKWSDLPPFLGLSILQVLAQRIGEWKGMRRLYMSRPSHAR